MEITEWRYGNWLNNSISGLDQREHIFHLCLFIGISIEYMDVTIRDGTWYVLNMQLTTKKSKRRDYLDIPGAGPYKDLRIRLHGWMWSTP